MLHFIRKVSIGFLFYLGTSFAFLLLFTGCTDNCNVSIHNCIIGNPSFFYINAILGIIFSICICKFVDDFSNNNSFMLYIKSFLLFFGKNSIYILVTHYYLTRHIFPYIIEKINLSDYLYSIPAESIFFILTILIMFPVCMFFSKHLLFLFAKRKNTST